MEFGHFDDRQSAFEITTPLTPRPWINYLGNRRLRAFVSQQAGGLLWHREPHAQRITRYHYLAPPADRPGFYLYVRDARDGRVWNPHFAPTCTPLDHYACRHQPGRTAFSGRRRGVTVSVNVFIPPADDVLLWQVRARNATRSPVALTLCSYLEFGLLEFMREILGWCYLKSHNRFSYDPAVQAIRYDYRVFEAPYAPRMAFGCSAPVASYDCSRDAFIGADGSLERPAAFARTGGLTDSELPLGGHGCGCLATKLELAPGAAAGLSYVFALGETWEATDALLRRYYEPTHVTQASAELDAFWAARCGRLQATTGEAAVDRFVNCWNPYNAVTALDLARTISTDHMGMDGLRYRDTTQDALAVAAIDPEFAEQRLLQVLATQRRDGGGCFAFYPDNPRPVSDEPHRSDNTVWQVDTVRALIAETGAWNLLDRQVPFREGGAAPVYEHLLLGLQHIHARRGPRGLPLLFDADWNDGLAIFGDPQAESVMLGMQMVGACRTLANWATRRNRPEDAVWCRQVAAELSAVLNRPPCWDGEWYARLLLSNGTAIGSRDRREGRIELTAQCWAVIAGVADATRGRQAMDAVARELDTDLGIRLLAPPFTGIPEPEDPPRGSLPGTNENGGIFCHANTWAILAEAMLGNAPQAWKYYRQLLPEHVIARVGGRHYEREPYAYVSTIVGPPSARMGTGGISWLTGTASWMYVVATQHLLGVEPTVDGLRLHPCLPPELAHLRVQRTFRGCRYDIRIENQGRGQVTLTLDGEPLAGNCLPLVDRPDCRVRCEL